MTGRLNPYYSRAWRERQALAEWEQRGGEELPPLASVALLEECLGEAEAAVVLDEPSL